MALIVRITRPALVAAGRITRPALMSSGQDFSSVWCSVNRAQLDLSLAVCGVSVVMNMGT